MTLKKISLTLLTWINLMQISFILAVFLIPFFLFFITGCTSRGDAIADTSPTMAEIYADAMHQSNGETIDMARSKVSTLSHHENFSIPNDSQAAINKINTLFPLLQNPQLIMYVYPHLAGNQESPVPGYFTGFSLYEKNYYAIPGER